MDARKLYQEIASAVQARRNCAESGNTEWFEKHGEKPYMELAPRNNRPMRGIPPSNLPLRPPTVIDVACHSLACGTHAEWTESD